VRPIPRNVRDAVGFLVYGRPDDEDCQPLDLAGAAAASSMKIDVLRRWLDRGQVRAYLLAERKAFRAAICAGNEAALQRVRDKSANGMVTVAAVRALEQMDEEGTAGRPLDPKQQPGIVIRVLTVQAPSPPAAPLDRTPPPRTIEHDPGPVR
jgi:hypothetical protein